MQSRTLYTKALELAFDRLDKQTAADHRDKRKENEIHQKAAENKLSERLGDLRDTPSTTCGKCNVCLSRALEREEVYSFSKRHLPRGCAKPSKKLLRKGMVPVYVHSYRCAFLPALNRASITLNSVHHQAIDHYRGKKRLNRRSTCPLAGAQSDNGL